MKVIIMTGTNKKQRLFRYAEAMVQELYDKNFVTSYKPNMTFEDKNVYMMKYKSHLNHTQIKYFTEIPLDSYVIIYTNVCNAVTMMAKIIDMSNGIHHGKNNELSFEYLNGAVSSLEGPVYIHHLISLGEISSDMWTFNEKDKMYHHVSTSVGVFDEDIDYDALTLISLMQPREQITSQKCPHGNCDVCGHNRYAPEYGQNVCYLEEDTKHDM